MHTDDELAALARAHLPADVAERWLPLCRPAVGLVPLRAGDVLTTVAGHLGGEPALPDDVPWPVTGDGRPLYHLATVDCAAVGLPARGRMVFFVDEALFDDDPDDADDADDDGPPAAEAARLVHVPAGTPVRPRATPARGNAYERTRLGARPGSTAPAADHPLVRREFGDAATAPGHPLHALAFARALASAGGEAEHRVGGHPSPLRRSVAYDVGGDPLAWQQLAQFDRSDPGIAWHGDDGVLLHWLIRADDLAAARFDRAVLTLRRPYRSVG